MKNLGTSNDFPFEKVMQNPKLEMNYIKYLVILMLM